MPTELLFWQWVAVMLVITASCYAAALALVLYGRNTGRLSPVDLSEKSSQSTRRNLLRSDSTEPMQPGKLNGIELLLTEAGQQIGQVSPETVTGSTIKHAARLQAPALPALATFGGQK